jgi:hypothetical protein
MAGRYLITGVQLGMLVAIRTQEERQTLAKQIEDKQYVGFSNSSIEQDVEMAEKIVNEIKG